MYDELTKQDIEKMRQELEHREKVLRPELIEEVKRTRAFGDLSENFEYKAAKREKNRNDSRIRYLTNMIRSATIIEDRSAADAVGLFDRVTLYLEEDGETMEVQVVTTVRCNPLEGRISRESPMGKALLGRRVGETVTVETDTGYRYPATIRQIEKAEDDGSAPILQY